MPAPFFVSAAKKNDELDRRTAIGYDTQDLELDLVVYPDGRWKIKDDELMDQRVSEERTSNQSVS